MHIYGILCDLSLHVFIYYSQFWQLYSSFQILNFFIVKTSKTLFPMFFFNIGKKIVQSLSPQTHASVQHYPKDLDSLWLLPSLHYATPLSLWYHWMQINSKRLPLFQTPHTRTCDTCLSMLSLFCLASCSPVSSALLQTTIFHPFYG